MSALQSEVTSEQIVDSEIGANENDLLIVEENLDVLNQPQELNEIFQMPNKYPERLLINRNKFTRVSYESFKCAFQTYNEEIADTFNRYAVNGTINQSQIQEFLTEVSERIHFDLAAALPFFAADSLKRYQKDIDINLISYKDCMNIFKVFQK